MYSVLIADDEKIERDFLRHVIGESGGRYQVVGEAENGEKTVALAESMRPDIVLADINMPSLGGLEAACQIKRRAPRTTIILNTAHAEFNFAQQAITCGVDAYLVKPAGAEQIIATLDNCMQKRQMPSQAAPARNILAVAPYPHELNDALLLCVQKLDADALEQEAANYVRFFESCYSDLGHYRIFIINTLFSISQALRKSSIPPSLSALLGEQVYIENISIARTWLEVLASLREFFGRMVMLYQGIKASNPSQMDFVASYIDEHYSEDLSLSELAAMVYLSPAYLSRKFREEKKMSLREYIIKRRMSEALKCLSQSNHSIRKIAEICGFSNQAYFQKVCKAYTGHMPSELRGRSLKEDIQ